MKTSPLGPVHHPTEMMHIAVIGECLLELNGTPFGTLHQTFGGDTLNTALYLARLASATARVKYVTVIGTDALSHGMVRRWQAEGIVTGLVLRDPARQAGLYMIQLDGRGERSFLYWRSDSAARYLMQHPDFERIAAELEKVDLIYVSGISLAILPAEDRARLIDFLIRLSGGGIALAFDTNYRAVLWKSADAARAAITKLLRATRLVFATFEDEQRLWGDDSPETTLARLHGGEASSVILKMGAAGCLYSDDNGVLKIPTLRVEAVIDTTAAGDAFNAGFLSEWITGRDPLGCCRAAHTLAARVIQHRGAIIPASAMPTLAELRAPWVH